MTKERLSKLPTSSPFIKKPFGGLTSTMLRTIAVILMLCDHMWATIIPGNNWLTNIGRLAFPIFAFLISEGFIHTSNLKKYILRLLIFALISEIPFNYFYGGGWLYPYHQNVMFTLLLGLLAISIIDKLKSNHSVKQIIKSVVLLLLLSLASAIGFVDYGFAGFLTVVMFYVFRNFPFAWVLQLVAMILMNITFFRGEMAIVEIFGKTYEIATQGYAVFALIPIWLYGGKKGYSNKITQYGFYAFYPVHMLVLYLILYFK